jgi:hypothetical protein
MDLADAAKEMRRLSRQIDSGLDVLRDQAKELAEAEHDYRRDSAVAWLEAPEGTVPEREAWVAGKTAKARRRRDLADHMSKAALESVRSRRTQVSALQSLLNAERESLAFARTGPQEGP